MSEMPAFNRIAQAKHGFLIYNCNDAYLGRSIELYGEYSEGETVIFDQILQPGNVVIEVGANIGTHTLFMAKKVGAEGRVLAFEPQRVVFQTLCGNMALNSITNAYCWNMAVGAKEGEITVPPLDYGQVNNFGGIELGKTETGENVPLITIDSFNLPACALLKIDAEGMEEDVLRGAQQTIQRLKPVLYFESDREGKQESMLKFVDSLGYSMYWHRPPLFNPENFSKNGVNAFGDIVSQNIICLDKTLNHELTGFQPVDLPNAA